MDCTASEISCRIVFIASHEEGWLMLDASELLETLDQRGASIDGISKLESVVVTNGK